MENHDIDNQIGPQTQPEKRGRGRPRGSGRGARRAQTQRPAATQEQVPDIVPVAPGPVLEPAQAAPLRSINPPVSRFTRVANALVFSRTVKGAVKTYRSEVFDAVFRPRQINPAIEQAARRVFNTNFEPYVSSGDEEEAAEPEFFRTSEGLRVSRKMRKFNTGVPVPVQDLAPSLATSGEIKRSEHPIGTRETACMMMANKNSLAHTAATLNIPKSTVHDYYKTYINTGRTHKIERKKPRVDLLSKEHKWAI